MWKEIAGNVMQWTVVLVVAGVAASVPAVALMVIVAFDGAAIFMGAAATATVLVARMFFQRDLQSWLGRLMLSVFISPSAIVLFVLMLRNPLVAGTSYLAGIYWTMVLYGLISFFDMARRPHSTGTSAEEFHAES